MKRELTPAEHAKMLSDHNRLPENRRVVRATPMKPTDYVASRADQFTDLLLRSNSWTDGAKITQKFSEREARMLAEWLVEQIAAGIPDTGYRAREKP